MKKPEAGVKDTLKKILKKYGRSVTFDMPVTTAIGKKELDFSITAFGLSIKVETKAGAKEPTLRQWLTMQRYERAGAIVMVLNEENSEGLDNLLRYLASGGRKGATIYSLSDTYIAGRIKAHQEPRPATSRRAVADRETMETLLLQDFDDS